MSRALILIVPLLATALPAAAQLTPEQRRAQEAKVANADFSRRLVEDWERRAQDGDPSGYGGFAARMERREVGERALWYRWRDQHEATPNTRDHWFALRDRPTALGDLHRAGPAARKVKAGNPSILTLASPYGGPSRTLMIRTAATSESAASGWSRMGEVTADESGRYLIVIPALTEGRYELAIEVYDPDRPFEPVSVSRSELVAK